MICSLARIPHFMSLRVVMAHTQLCGSIPHGQPLPVLLGGAVAMDATNAAYRPDNGAPSRSCLEPDGIPACGSVMRQCLIGHRPTMLRMTARACSGRAATVFTCSRLMDAQLGMHAAFPVDDQHDLTSHRVDINHDLGDRVPRTSRWRVSSWFAAPSVPPRDHRTIQ